MYVICVDFTIRPERVLDFMPLMKLQAENSMIQETGCKRFDVCIDPDDISKVFLYELYDSKRAFDAHLASKHFIEFDQATAEMVTTRTVRALELS